MDRELARHLILAIVLGLASGYGRGVFGAPDADLVRRIEALEAVCGRLGE